MNWMTVEGCDVIKEDDVDLWRKFSQETMQQSL